MVATAAPAWRRLSGADVDDVTAVEFLMTGSLGRGDVEQPRDDEDDCREEAAAEAETDGARAAGVLMTMDDAARSVARAIAGRMIERVSLPTRKTAGSGWICRKEADDGSSRVVADVELVYSADVCVRSSGVESTQWRVWFGTVSTRRKCGRLKGINQVFHLCL